MKALSKLYNKQLNQNPLNVGTWLKFIEIQDKVGMVGQKALTNAMLERKGAIVEKALNYNPESEELALIYLQLLGEMQK